jgi:hypothetical protein
MVSTREGAYPPASFAAPAGKMGPSNSSQRTLAHRTVVRERRFTISATWPRWTLSSCHRQMHASSRTGEPSAIQSIHAKRTKAAHLGAYYRLVRPVSLGGVNMDMRCFR